MNINDSPKYKTGDRVFDLVVMRPAVIHDITPEYFAVFYTDFSVEHQAKLKGFKRKARDIVPLEKVLEMLVLKGADAIVKEAFIGEEDK